MSQVSCFFTPVLQDAVRCGSFDWPEVRSALIGRLELLNSTESHDDSLSPSSTVVAPVDRITTKEQIVEYVIDTIRKSNDAPVAIHRLCELVITAKELNERLVWSLERVVSSSRSVEGPSFFLNSGSPLSRTLRRPYS
jgi:hypothetical protein